MTEDDVRRIVREAVAAELPRLKAELQAAERPISIRVNADGAGMRAFVHGQRCYDPRI